MNCPKCGNDLAGGQKFCSKCGYNVQGQPASPAQMAASLQPQAVRRPPAQQSQDAAQNPYFNFEKLLVNQKKLSLDTSYYVYDEQGNEKFFVSRKLFSLMIQFTVFSDRSKQNKLLHVTSGGFIHSLMGRHIAYGADGTPIALMNRRIFLSVLRRTWNILSPDGALLCVAHEDSWGKALFRRFGPLGELLKTDFIFQAGERIIGKFIRKWTLFDKYVIDFTGDPQHSLDRRVALAMCILLDVAEGR